VALGDDHAHSSVEEHVVAVNVLDSCIRGIPREVEASPTDVAVGDTSDFSTTAIGGPDFGAIDVVELNCEVRKALHCAAIE